MAVKKKACKNCGALVNVEVNVCPVCKNNQFSTNWRGRIIILDVEKSKLAKMLNIKKEGEYAIKK